jgi:hypothetical protein
MPRLLSRALLVLGGATAATATAWLLSSGTAAADPLPQVSAATSHVVSTSDTNGTAAAPFETPLSTAVSSVADPVTDTGSTAVTAVTEPSQHAVLPLPAVPATAPADLGQLASGLRDTVGGLGDRLPVSTSLPTELVQHLGRVPVSTAAVPAIAAPAVSTTPRHLPMQAAPFAGQHSRVGGVVGQVNGPGQRDRGAPLAPHNPGNSPFGPLTVPAMPGGGGSGNGGFAGPAGLGLPTGTVAHLFPELHVVDVLAPATEPAAVMPGKQPGVTPD